MLLVVSNVSKEWDTDMWGVVGVVPNVKGVLDVASTVTSEEFFLVEGENNCFRMFEQEEVAYLCEGKPVAYAMNDEETKFFIVVELI